MSSQSEWLCKRFEELRSAELYSILKLRIEVFIIEQNCIFQDADDKDSFCYHLMNFRGNQLAAYTRLVPAGISFKEISIGRVVTDSQFRNLGLGKELMQRSIDMIWNIYGVQPIRIGAQVYLEAFYSSFGFKKAGEIYLEDGIPHVEMVLNP